MAKIYGQLERAQIENVGSDPSGGGLSSGRVWFRTDTSKLYVYNGAAKKEILFSPYSTFALPTSDGSADQILRTDGAGQLSFVTNSGGGTPNLGVALSSGTFTINQSSGSALSSSAPAYINLPSSVTAGKRITLKVTANATFNDDSFAGTSDIAGINFGTTAGVAWSIFPCPFYVYACNTDDTDAGVYFFISRIPWQNIAAGANNIAYKTVTPTLESCGVNFFLTSSNVKSAAASKPCVLLGGVRMSKSAANDWTVQSLDYATYNEGITSDPYNKTGFLFPLGHSGAAAGTHFYNGGSGTAPSWASASEADYLYYLNKSGLVRIYYSSKSAGNCTNGSTTNQLRLTTPVPYSSLGSTLSSIGGIGDYVASAASTTSGVANAQLFGDTSFIYLLEHNGTTTLKNNSFSSASDDISVSTTLVGSS